MGTASSGLVGENDLLIVGPGVLGRLVAEKWRQVIFLFHYKIIIIVAICSFLVSSSDFECLGLKENCVVFLFWVFVLC